MRNLSIGLIAFAGLCVIGAIFVGATSGNVVVLTAQTETGMLALLFAIALGIWFKD